MPTKASKEHLEFNFTIRSFAIVTGPLWALVFDERPGVYSKESLELLIQLIDDLKHLLQFSQFLSFKCHTTLKYPMTDDTIEQ